MLKRQLGRTGLNVTQLGYGTMGLRGPRTWGVRVVNDAAAERFLNLVLDSGINFIDTAPDYGITEQRIGQFISSRRDEFFLATKCGCAPVQHEDHLETRHIWTRDVVVQNLENSLRRMRTDHIDILQFHGGNAATLQREGLIDLLLDFRSQGKIRFIGVSSSLPDLPALIELGVFDTFQIPLLGSRTAASRIDHASCTNRRGIIIRGEVAQGGT